MPDPAPQQKADELLLHRLDAYPDATHSVLIEFDGTFDDNNENRAHLMKNGVVLGAPIGKFIIGTTTKDGLTFLNTFAPCRRINPS